MGYFLLTPKFVIYWAWRQHCAARDFAKKHSKGHPSWTRTHAFFLIMGGFALHKGGKPVRILEAEELERLSEMGEIEWPMITKAEIEDRSKGDYLSKTIVLFQTTWFIGQCIARGAYGLTVTELEVVTIAFASLTGIVYYLWWDKPLDVRCSIPVHLLDGHLKLGEGDIKKEETRSQITPSSLISAPKISDHEIPEEGEGALVPPGPFPSAGRDETTILDPPLTTSRSHNIFPPEASDQRVLQGNDKVDIHTDPLPSSRSSLDPALIRMKRFQDFRSDACEEYGTFLGLGYVFIGFPVKRFLSAFDDMMDCDRLKDNVLRVPTFYSAKNDDVEYDLVPLALAACVSIVFGAIHCIAWSFHFATWHERWLWRISAIFISGLPISVFATVVLNDLLINMGPFGKLIFYPQISLYIIARIILLVLPFVALRALPPGAYVQLNWISFIPHI
ncbi:hypothetical protein M413DRAFT_445824 [Hebeloma cylindrosporum]|uniref:Uncharacterized protein n=1 Tax=Hebeloma cylindrosporum TaxID=76867 RepID=A0A0C2YJB8_HEBCY|nr:hypothetical protein M413DRAFT_445824 [Hebeloma cylindrosporum h7]